MQIVLYLKKVKKCKENWPQTCQLNSSAQCTYYTNTVGLQIVLSMYGKLCVRERKKEYTFQLMFFFLLCLLHILMPWWWVGDSQIKHWHKFRCSVFSMVGLNKTKTRNSLERYYISWQCFMWEPSTHHQALTRNRHLQQKKKEHKLKCVLSITHTKLDIHAQGKYCNPTVCVEYTFEYCCSVGSFGAKFIFLIQKSCYFIRMNFFHQIYQML